MKKSVWWDMFFGDGFPLFLLVVILFSLLLGGAIGAAYHQ